MSEPRMDPARWDAPKAPALTGAFARNDRLDHVERWPIPGGHGPEDIAFGPDGTLYTGVEDGRILAFRTPGGPPDEVAMTGGRPLGIEVDRDGTLVVSDASRGLLRIDPATGETTILAAAHDGARMRLVDNAAIADDGRTFFSDSTQRHDLATYLADLFEHRPTGRLLVRDPENGTTRVLVDRLMFANGVALAPDGSFVLVAETGRYRIQRLWLSGPRAGSLEPFVDNLPAFPDNVSSTADGRFWVALPSLRDPLSDRLLAYPGVRRLAWKLPDRLKFSGSRYGFVACFDAGGRLLDQLQGEAYAFITGVREHDGWLYLGSLREDAVARVRL